MITPVLRSGPSPHLDHREPVVAVGLEFEVSVGLGFGTGEGDTLGRSIENLYRRCVGLDDHVLCDSAFTERKEQSNLGGREREGDRGGGSVVGDELAAIGFGERVAGGFFQQCHLPVVGGPLGVFVRTFRESSVDHVGVKPPGDSIRDYTSESWYDDIEQFAAIVERRALARR